MIKTEISQRLLTIQGEGPLVGSPCLLIRYKNCNLICPFCDTKKLIKLKISPINKNQSPIIITDKNQDKFIENTMQLIVKENIKHLLFTGGEPLLSTPGNSEFTMRLLKRIADNYIPINNIEIETNGTNINSDMLYEMQNIKSLLNTKITLNISPKLQPNCYKNSKSFDDITAMFSPIFNLLNFYNFDYVCKFVYANIFSSDILKFINKHNIEKNKIYLLPLTPNVKKGYTYDDISFINDLRKSYLDTIKFAMFYNFKVSSRDHIFIYGSNTNELKCI